MQIFILYCDNTLLYLFMRFILVILQKSCLETLVRLPNISSSLSAINYDPNLFTSNIILSTSSSVKFGWFGIDTTLLPTSSVIGNFEVPL